LTKKKKTELCSWVTSKEMQASRIRSVLWLIYSFMFPSVGSIPTFEHRYVTICRNPKCI
jgi:hypothetical protein